MESKSKAYMVLKMPCTLFIWYVCSVLVNIEWKQAYRKHPNSIYLTCVQFFVAEIITCPIFLCCKLNDNNISLNQFNRMYLLIGVAFAVGQLCTNMSLSIVTVSATHIIKISEPVIALVFGVAILKDKVTKGSLLYMGLILIGIAIATISDRSFQYYGMLFAGLSNVSLQIRNLLIKIIKRDHAKQVTGLITFILSNTIGLCLLLIMTIMHVSYNGGSALFFSELDNQCIRIGVWFGGQHIASYFVLQDMSLSTHALLNVIKRLLIIVISSVILQTPLTALQVFGIGLALGGFYLYSMAIEIEGLAGIVSIARNFNGAIHKLFTMCLVITLVYFGYFPISHTRQLAATKSMTPINFIWAYSDGPDPSSIALIEAISKQNAKRPLTVYCGSSNCWDSIAHLSGGNVKVQQLEVLELVAQTPLRSWARRHALMKINLGPAYERHLQTALQLALAWKTGDIVISLDLHVLKLNKFVSRLDFLEINTCLISSEKNPLKLCNLRRKHPFVERLMHKFAAVFKIKKQMSWPLQFDFRNVVAETVESYTVWRGEHIPKDVTHIFSTLLGPRKNHSAITSFGLLTYTTVNIGDDVQSIAAAHFLPHIDLFIQRDARKYKFKKNITLILNGFWHHDRLQLFDMPGINPILVAVHLNNALLNSTKQVLLQKKEYLSTHGLVGARDIDTMHAFLKLGIKSEFSGCITLFIQNPFEGILRGKTIYLVDVLTKSFGKELFPSQARFNWTALTHSCRAGCIKNTIAISRFNNAYKLLERYAQAKLVVTTRLHVALPCVAMGTPVIFLNMRDLYGSTNVKPSARLAGFTNLFHTVDMYNMTKKEAHHFIHTFNWENPPPNPNPQLSDHLRKVASSILTQSHDIEYDMKMYGLLSAHHELSNQ